ncbi:MAG: hypothetical protein Q9M36_08970 [Sulfurovum sp.]|nr:hypothetical protein [Sulfurovum sp.]
MYKPYYTGVLLPRLLALDSRVFFNVSYMFNRNILGQHRFKVGMTHVEDLLFYLLLSIQKNIKYGYIAESIYIYRSGNSSAMMDLDGLEEGYIIFLQEIKGKISNLAYFYLKVKILKIMFLSWLSHKELILGIKSLWHLLVQK